MGVQIPLPQHDLIMPPKGGIVFELFTNQEGGNHMDMRRITLHAAIQKLIAGVSIPENVNTCYESLVSIFAEVDDIRHQKRKSEGTNWTKEALEYVDLKKLGNFDVQVITRKKERLISFTNENVTLEFIFKHVPPKAIDQLSSVLKRASTPDRSEQKTVADAFLKSVVQESLHGKSVSSEELLLEGKPSALNDYRLQYVQLKEPYENLFKIFSFFRRNRLVYTAPHN